MPVSHYQSQIMLDDNDNRSSHFPVRKEMDQLEILDPEFAPHHFEIHQNLRPEAMLLSNHRIRGGQSNDKD
jgi:hypothetical protein